jgi:hypothetical protein
VRERETKKGKLFDRYRKPFLFDVQKTHPSFAFETFFPGRKEGRKGEGRGAG